jgi:hypothetical protein
VKEARACRKISRVFLLAFCPDLIASPGRCCLVATSRRE